MTYLRVLALGALLAAVPLVIAALLWLGTTARAGAQVETGTCPDVQLIDEFRGTGNQTTDTFRTTTDSFRVRWEVDEGNTTDPNLTPNLLVEVNDDEDIPVSTGTQDGGGTGQTFVNEPPGTYSLDITFIGGQGATYTVTVEQCEGGGSPSANPGGRTTQQSPPPKKTSPSPPSPSPPPSPRPTPPPPSTQPTPTPAPPFKAGGAEAGPVPLMPNGGCPKEFPIKQGKACYVA
jgi:hypothetical protein